MAVHVHAQSPSQPTSPPVTTAPVAPTVPTNPLPQTAVFAFAGYGTKVDGSIGYAQLLSQASQTYSLTTIRYVPTHGSLSVTIPVVMTGAAIHLRDMKWLSVYGIPHLGGGSTTSGATVGSFSFGGMGIIRPSKWKHWGIAAGADMQKTAGGKAYPNFDLGPVFIP